MNQEISKDNFVLVLHGEIKIWLSNEEAEAVKNAIRRGVKFIEVKGGMIGLETIRYVMSRMNYEEGERIKRGEYKCPIGGEWIPKFKTCGIHL